MSDLAYLPATEALARFRERELSPVELVTAVIERAERVEPSIGAFCETRYEQALEAARAAELRYAGRGEAPRALEGLPVALKEEHALAGEPLRLGSLVTGDKPEPATHPVLERVLAAGAIPHARSTTPEFSCAGFTHSRLWGVTRNPWQLGRSPGGSSGGSAAALAAGGATLATGSDIVYGGSLSMISIADSFGHVNPTRRLRIITIVGMAFVVWGIAQFVGEERFFDFYGNALVFLAYLFTPWTAINLVDYFFIRRGDYVLREIFNPAGIYGRWGWRGNTAYLVTLGIMALFFVTTPYTGPIAERLHSVDYSIFVGLPVAAALYWLLCRDLDLEHERRMVADEGILEHKRKRRA